MTRTNPITCSLEEEFAVKYLALPTKKQLEKLFDWDENGSLRWKVRVARAVAIGEEAGYITKNNYLNVTIKHKQYKKHRILFVLYHGKNNLGDKKVDHIDGNPSNNAKSNLRIETKNHNNSINCVLYKNNQSGCKGVNWDKRHKKWHSQIQINCKKKCLGYYDNFIYACVVRRRAAKLYHGDWRKD